MWAMIEKLRMRRGSMRRVEGLGSRIGPIGSAALIRRTAVAGGEAVSYPVARWRSRGPLLLTQTRIFEDRRLETQRPLRVGIQAFFLGELCVSAFQRLSGGSLKSS